MLTRDRIPALKRRRTKIVATVGPSSTDPETLGRLIRAGVNIFRLNMSHGDHTTHRTAYERIRAVATQLEEPIAILADLCGPKIRVGRFVGGAIELEDGAAVTVTTREVMGEPGLIPSQYEALAEDLKSGDRILLSDGLLELRVEQIEGTEIQCSVVHGGTLKDRKGMNLPGVAVSAPSLTDKDRVDAQFAVELGVEFLALSFVRRASDVHELRSLLPHGSQIAIIPKIERPEALDDIDAILEAADGIMVARGDLGVEMPPEDVPIVQRALVSRARALRKPTIVATQMLESMIENPQPTRAEVSDVANAVLSGADAVMLSGETAAGAYPVRAVEIMDRTARRAEGYLWAEGAFGSITHADVAHPPVPLHVAVARSTALLSRDLEVRGIVVFTTSGVTAGVVAAARPAAPILVVTPDVSTCRRINLLWGVIPISVSEQDPIRRRPLARKLVRDLGLAKSGDHILSVSGFGAPGVENAPTVTVLTV